MNLQSRIITLRPSAVEICAASASVGCVVAAVLLCGLPVVSSLLWFLSALLLPMLVYRRMPYRSRPCTLLLLAVWMILSVSAVVSLWFVTGRTGAPIGYPAFAVPDSHVLYSSSLTYALGIAPEWHFRPIYCLFGIIMKCTGLTPLPFLGLGCMAALTAMLCIGYICSLLPVGTRWTRQRLAFAGMLMMSCVGEFLGFSSQVLREPFVVAGLSLVAVFPAMVLSASHTSRSLRWAWCAAILGVALIWLARPQCLIYCMILAVISMRFPWRRLANPLGLLFLSIAFWTAYECREAQAGPRWSSRITVSELAPELVPHSQEKDMNLMLSLADTSEGKGPYGFFVVDYLTEYPLWKRMASLPLTASVQAVIPLFWNVGSISDAGPCMWLAYMSFGKYLILGLFLYFPCVCCKGGAAPGWLKRFALAGSIFWLVPAFLMAGTVSRYALSAMLLLLPCALWTLLESWRKRRFRIYCAVFVSVLVIGLTCVWALQKFG